MTKRELINALEAINIPDNCDVKIWDHEKDARDGGDGESPSTAQYDFTVGVLNEDLSDDEKEFFKQTYGWYPKPFIVLGFDNPEIEN